MSITQQFKKEYRDSGQKPLPVAIRDIVKRGTSSQFTHLIHPYTAKLLPHIPQLFLSDKELLSEKSKVLDPFSGSGTVLLEAMVNGHDCMGADSNPLARMITHAKLTPLSFEVVGTYLEKLLQAIPDTPEKPLPHTSIDLKYWFYPKVTMQLRCLHEAICNAPFPAEVKNFFTICFSSCIRKVSLADPRLSVPVRLSYEKYHETHPLRESCRKRIYQLRRVDVIKLFEQVCLRNAQRVHDLYSHDKLGNLLSVSHDARSLKTQSARKVNKNSIDLVITSPPYAGAQKYVRASSLNLAWLQLLPENSLTPLKKVSIGREDYRKADYSDLIKTNIPAADRLLKQIYEVYPLRAHIAANYLIEMRDAFSESVRVLKPGGSFVLVAANNVICKQAFLTVDYLKAILEDLELTLSFELVDTIKSRGLMTKRNKTASVIDSEHVLMFSKD